MGVASIRFITIGGMQAISLSENRPRTSDIDVLLDPNVDYVKEYREDVLRVIHTVAERGGIQR